METPSSDYYGGHRPGNNLFAESLVAVDLKTGKRKWHYQLVHHPIWNFDITSAPVLADITVNGKTVKAVAVATKQAFLYVFDRITGQPVWPMEERPEPKGDVPGEWYSPTQPHPTKPPAYARNYLKVPDDLVDFTPALRAEALEVVKRYKVAETPFNPPILGNVNGLLGAFGGGTATNWPGGGYDPETHIFYTQALNTGVILRSLAPMPPGFSDIRYGSGVDGRSFREALGAGFGTYADDAASPRRRPAAVAPPAPPAESGAPAAAAEGGGFPTVQGLPIVKPPYGVLAAVHLDRGDLLWQVPHGDTPDVVRNHPALKSLTLPKTGQAGQSVGLVVTKTLVIVGDPQLSTAPNRPRGAFLRAYHKATGEQVGALWIPAVQSGSPMTYNVDGKQYILLAVSGGNYSGEYIAFSLPRGDTTTSQDH